VSGRYICFPGVRREPAPGPTDGLAVTGLDEYDFVRDPFTHDVCFLTVGWRHVVTWWSLNLID
jgi:hypothetical protein